MKKSKRKGSGPKARQDDNEDIGLTKKWMKAYEPSDSEDDYSQQEKMLLEKARTQSSRHNTNKKRAVMDLPSDGDDDEDDDNEGQHPYMKAKGGDHYGDGEDDGDDDDDDNEDSMASDIEGQGDDGFNLPDQRAWGQKRRNYYNTDYVDQDYGGFDGDDAEAAELEEQEAREIQQRLAAELDDDDFSLNVFSKKDEEKGSGVNMKSTEEVIKTDLSQLTTRQKLTLLQKEAPELMGIVAEFREIMNDVLVRLQPAVKLLLEGRIQSPEIAHFIRTKLHLCSNYALNMGFYLLLRSRRLPVAAHPVIKRLLQYRQLLQRLQPLHDLVSPQLDELLAAAVRGELPVVDKNLSSRKTAKNKITLACISKKADESYKADSRDHEVSEVKQSRKKRKQKDDGDLPVKGKESVEPPLPAKKAKKTENKMPWEDGLEDSDNADSGTPWAQDGLGSDGDTDEADRNDNEEGNGGTEVTDEDAKRAITWQMAKNKGLTPHRKKEQRNPRVKNRNKFRKAKIRRKGQVREARTEMQRYGGEISGIKASVSKSIKIK